MESNKMAMEQAVELFDQRQYREAFGTFAKLYNQSQDKSERKNYF